MSDDEPRPVSIVVQWHDATPEQPTPCGPFWAIDVIRGGDVIADQSTLLLWLNAPWGDAWLKTPHRGWGYGVYLPEELHRPFAGALEPDWLDVLGPGDSGRLISALRVLFPGAEATILPPRPAPAWPRACRLA